MNTKLLDGLEMFLGVFVTSLNSSNLQMPGRWHIYSPSSRTSCLEPLPNFLHMHRCIRRYSTGASGHSTPEVAVGSSEVLPDKPVPCLRFIRCCSLLCNCHGIAPVPCTGDHRLTVAEELLLGCLTCSLMHDMVLAPVHHLGTTGASGGT